MKKRNIILIISVALALSAVIVFFTVLRKRGGSDPGTQIEEIIAICPFIPVPRKRWG